MFEFPVPTVPTTLEHFAAHVDQASTLSAAVSQATLGWHIDHACRVIIQVVAALEQPQAVPFHWRFNLNRCYVHSTGHIPRGKGRAPQSVVPPQSLTATDLRLQTEQAQAAWERLGHLPPEVYFAHPYFGDLNLRMTRRFLSIHTYHHWKIIRDILTDTAGSPPRQRSQP